MEERDDYPIIPQPENKTDEFRLQNYRAMENRLLSANSDVKHLKEELASLKEVVKDLLPLAQEVFDSITIDDAETHREYISLKALLDRAKRISDNK